MHEDIRECQVFYSILQIHTQNNHNGSFNDRLACHVLPSNAYIQRMLLGNRAHPFKADPTERKLVGSFGWMIATRMCICHWLKRSGPCGVHAICHPRVTIFRLLVLGPQGIKCCATQFDTYHSGYDIRFRLYQSE